MVSSFGFDVTTAGDGQEALEKLEVSAPNAILADLVMPRMDGFALLKELGRRGDQPPTIILTAMGSVDHAISMVHDLKAFWFLEKPVQPGVLRTLLERAIQQGHSPQRSGRPAPATELSGRIGRSGGQLAADDGSFFPDPPGGAHIGIRADQRRKRHWKRTGGARHPQVEFAARRAVRRGELRGAAGNSDGERAFRP
jgi:CheY-like chemotaxis protein